MEWLWKYEYFIDLRKMAYNKNNVSKKNLIYDNMLFLATTDKFEDYIYNYIISHNIIHG